MNKIAFQLSFLVLSICVGGCSTTPKVKSDAAYTCGTLIADPYHYNDAADKWANDYAQSDLGLAKKWQLDGDNRYFINIVGKKDEKYTLRLAFDVICQAHPERAFQVAVAEAFHNEKAIAPSIEAFNLHVAEAIRTKRRMEAEYQASGEAAEDEAYRRQTMDRVNSMLIDAVVGASAGGTTTSGSATTAPYAGSVAEASDSTARSSQDLGYISCRYSSGPVPLTTTYPDDRAVFVSVGVSATAKEVSSYEAKFGNLIRSKYGVGYASSSCRFFPSYSEASQFADGWMQPQCQSQRRPRVLCYEQQM